MNPRIKAKQAYKQIIQNARANDEEAAAMRELATRDLFFLAVFVLRRKFLDNDFAFERCRELQADPNGYLDLWAREHLKSTLITFCLTIQTILKNPEVTIGIFSCTKPLAKKHFSLIKSELEENKILPQIAPDIFWANPKKEAPRWSEEKGICVRRKTNPKEATIEAWGVVDGQPTGAHFQILIYDDIVTRESVTTPEMIQKVTEATQLSFNLGARGGTRRFIGTRYHYNDTYKTLLDQGTVIPRIIPATEDGTVDGKPIYLTPQEIAEKRRDMGPYVFACQMLQDPKQDGAIGFDEAWLRYWPADHAKNLNIYFVVDPASEKKKDSDYTVFWVIGLGADENYYVLDIVRDRMSLTEKGNVLFSLHRKWKPVAVGYEKYGAQTDIQYFEEKGRQENYRFQIIPLGGSEGKNDRIQKLIPYFESGRIFLPDNCIHTDYSGVTQDLVKIFLNNEYKPFPFTAHDDMLDALQRILDPKLGAAFPMGDRIDPFGIDKMPSSVVYEDYDPFEAL